MCPFAPPPPPDDISTYWTDEELCLSLERMIRGFPLPGNVIADINPYQLIPSNLPDGIWYFIRSEEKKDAEAGFWKAKGASCRIFTNSVITGWRTTFEFFEGQAPHDHKTDWVMQEYRITQTGMHENTKLKLDYMQDLSVLCRVFHSHRQSPNNEMQHKLAPADAGGNYTPSAIHTDKNNNASKGSTSKPQVEGSGDETRPLPMMERFLNRPVENLPEVDCVSNGDFLELLDLVNHGSPSSSSDNSSRVSMSSDECFDSLALLQDLEAEDIKGMQQKNADCKFSILTHVRSKEVVVMCPAIPGSQISDSGNKSPTKALKTELSLLASATEQEPHGKMLKSPTIRTLKEVQTREGLSPKSCDVGESSCGHKPALEREKEPARSRKKKIKKYFCFIPL